MREEVLRKLRELRKTAEDDPEIAHAEADAILCVFLLELGEQEVVTAWREIKPKHYS